MWKWNVESRLEHARIKTYCTAAVFLCILTLNHFFASWCDKKDKTSCMNCTQYGANTAKKINK